MAKRLKMRVKNFAKRLINFLEAPNSVVIIVVLHGNKMCERIKRYLLGFQGDIITKNINDFSDLSANDVHSLYPLLIVVENSQSWRKTYNTLRKYGKNVRVYKIHPSMKVLEASAPMVFFYCGEHSIVYGGIALCQATTNRVYIYIREVLDGEEGGIEYWAYDRTGKLFRYNLPKTPPEDWVDIFKAIEQYSNYMVSKNHSEFRHLINLRNSIKIVVFSCIRSGSGMNWSGAFSSALAYGVLRFYGLINEDAHETWRKLVMRNNLEQIIFDESFQKVNHLALWLEMHFHGGMASGYGTYISIIGSPLPTLFIRLKEEKIEICAVEGADEHCDYKRSLDTIKDLINYMYVTTLIKGQDISELIKRFNTSIFIAAIETYRPKSTKRKIEQIKKHVRKNFMFIDSNFINWLLGEILPVDLDEKIKIKFLDILGLINPYLRDENIGKVILFNFHNLLNLNVIKSLKELLKTKYAPYKYRRKILPFLRAIRTLHKFLINIMGLDWEEFRIFREQILNYVLNDRDYRHRRYCCGYGNLATKNIAFKLTGAGGGGVFLLFSYKGCFDFSDLAKFMKTTGLEKDYAIIWTSDELEDVHGIDAKWLNVFDSDLEVIKEEIVRRYGTNICCKDIPKIIGELQYLPEKILEAIHKIQSERGG